MLHQIFPFLCCKQLKMYETLLTDNSHISQSKIPLGKFEFVQG